MLKPDENGVITSRSMCKMLVVQAAPLFKRAVSEKDFFSNYMRGARETFGTNELFILLMGFGLCALTMSNSNTEETVDLFEDVFSAEEVKVLEEIAEKSSDRALAAIKRAASKKGGSHV